MNAKSKKLSRAVLLNVFRYAFLLGLVFTILYPQLNKIAISFRSNADLVDSSIIFLPKHFVFDAFLEAGNAMNYWSTFFRTVLICGVSALLHVISCTMTAYSVAKFDYFGKKIVYCCVLLTFLVPPSLISLPLYTNFQSFDILGIFKAVSGKGIMLLDNPLSLMFLYATANCLKSGLFIYLLIQYFKNLPKVLDEAAEVDGASNLMILTRIALPAARTMLVTVFLFTFVWQWTDIYYSEMFFNDMPIMSSALTGVTAHYTPLATGVGAVQSTFIKLSQMSSAGSILFTLPLLILYLTCNKAFVQGIERSGIVG